MVLDKIYEKLDNSIQELPDGYQMYVSDNNSWSGIRLVSEFYPDNAYVVNIKANAENDYSLLEIILPTVKGEIHISSFVVDREIREYQFIFTPLFDSNSLSFRMSTFGGFATGKIYIKNINISDLFPIYDNSDLSEKIKILGPWFHQLDLKGIRTRDIYRTDSPSIPEGFISSFTEQDYINNPSWIWSKFKHSIDTDLTGKEILDVACNCGFYSFELAKRGAKVTSIDNSYQDIVRAKFAKKVLGINNVDFQFADAKELENEFSMKFDLVLCLGLLYHLENPQSIIDTISRKSNIAVFETIVDERDIMIEKIEDHRKTEDGYVPTEKWLRNAFKKAGFSSITRITPDNFYRMVFLCKK